MPHSQCDLQEWPRSITQFQKSHIITDITTPPAQLPPQPHRSQLHLSIVGEVRETQNEQGVRNLRGNITGCCCIRESESRQTRRKGSVPAPWWVVSCRLCYWTLSPRKKANQIERVSFTHGAAFSTDPKKEIPIPVQHRNFMRAESMNPVNDPRIVPRRRICTQ